MQFPLSLWDMSLWLAAMAIILLVTVEVIALGDEQEGFINHRRLEKVALIMGVLFLMTVVLGMFT
jgi:hypothetical protein